MGPVSPPLCRQNVAPAAAAAAMPLRRPPAPRRQDPAWQVSPGGGRQAPALRRGLAGASARRAGRAAEYGERAGGGPRHQLQRGRVKHWRIYQRNSQPVGRVAEQAEGLLSSFNEGVSGISDSLSETVNQLTESIGGERLSEAKEKTEEWKETLNKGATWISNTLG